MTTSECWLVFFEAVLFNITNCLVQLQLVHLFCSWSLSAGSLVLFHFDVDEELGASEFYLCSPGCCINVPKASSLRERWNQLVLWNSLSPRGGIMHLCDHMGLGCEELNLCSFVTAWSLRKDRRFMTKYQTRKKMSVPSTIKVCVFCPMLVWNLTEKNKTLTVCRWD